VSSSAGSAPEGNGAVRAPELVGLVTAGALADEARLVASGIFLSPGVSNSYLVTTPEGDVLINSGMPHEGERHRARYAAVSAGPVRTIIFTQGHIDHIGGWPSFAGPGVETVVQSDFDDVQEYWSRLRAFYRARTQRLWSKVLPASSGDNEPRLVPPQPTVRFEDSYSLEVGKRQIELISTPGGETTDSLIVWLPNDRIVFTGNLMGPIFGHIPNLYTIRGDKIRSALEFVRSVDRVRSLAPEILITGHGDPIVGASLIHRHLTQIIDAVTFLRDATLTGMNQGKDLYTLMREVTLPPELALRQGHGKVSWNVRAMWEEYTGWFQYESTTELYAVPAKAVWAELAELAGGAAALAQAAERHLAADRPLHALHLLDIASAADGSNTRIQLRKVDALEQLLGSSGHENLSETMWLENEIRAARPVQPIANERDEVSNE